MKVEYNHAYCVFEDVKSLILGVTCLKKNSGYVLKVNFVPFLPIFGIS